MVAAYSSAGEPSATITGTRYLGYVISDTITGTRYLGHVEPSAECVRENVTRFWIFR